MPKASTKTPTQTPANLARIDARGSVLVKPLKPLVEGLDITTPEDYQEADALLGRVIAKRREWSEDCEEILAPLRTAKTAADAVKRKYDKPLEQLEVMVREKMRDYKREEYTRQAEAQRAADEAAEAIRRQLEETEERAQTARTAQMREKLAAKRDQLATRIEEVAAEVPEETKAAGSTTRTVKAYRVTDHVALIRACLDGHTGAFTPDMVTINSAMLTHIFRAPGGHELVASFPGIEVYDDIQIVRR